MWWINFRSNYITKSHCITDKDHWNHLSRTPCGRKSQERILSLTHPVSLWWHAFPLHAVYPSCVVPSASCILPVLSPYPGLWHPCNSYRFLNFPSKVSFVSLSDMSSLLCPGKKAVIVGNRYLTWRNIVTLRKVKVTLSMALCFSWVTFKLCFQFLATLNKEAVNMVEQCLCGRMKCLLDIFPRVIKLTFGVYLMSSS